MIDDCFRFREYAECLTGVILFFSTEKYTLFNFTCFTTDNKVVWTIFVREKSKTR